MTGTPFSILIEKFLHLVEKDKSYFRYFELTDEQAMELARLRASHFLDEAVGRLIFEGKPTVDFTDIDVATQSFNFELTSRELTLLPSLMYQVYLERDIAYLKTLSVNFVDKNLKTYDPSNARQSFLTLYNTIAARNAAWIDDYKNCDRTSGDFNPITFAAYDITEA